MASRPNPSPPLRVPPQTLAARGARRAPDHKPARVTLAGGRPLAGRVNINSHSFIRSAFLVFLTHALYMLSGTLSALLLATAARTPALDTLPGASLHEVSGDGFVRQPRALKDGLSAADKGRALAQRRRADIGNVCLAAAGRQVLGALLHNRRGVLGDQTEEQTAKVLVPLLISLL